MSTFEAWPKIPRWNRSVVITEKIDGTNGAIIIEPQDDFTAAEDPFRLAFVDHEGGRYQVHAQSRTRLVRPGADNFGFATWVQERAEGLVKLLGPGRHFGEFYGKGIARNYGLDHRRFALFNTKRWSEDARGYDGHDYQLVPGLEVDVVPVLTTLDHPDEAAILRHLNILRFGSSRLVPGFDKPEGIVLYHTAAGQTFKILLEGDDLPKGVVPRAEREMEALRSGEFVTDQSGRVLKDRRAVPA